MMRNALPLLSRAPAPSRPASPPPAFETPPPPVPTIRLISATPSVTNATMGHDMSLSSVAPFVSSPLAPRTDTEGSRKRIVPKKSKLALLGGGKSKGRSNKDFSDVIRRVGGNESTGRGGFEIYVDQGEDPDLGEIVVVKKKKSRLGLDGMSWGPLGEVTNVPSVPKAQNGAQADGLLKIKGEDSQKWWSIGRGRKDSKEKEKPKQKEKERSRVRSKTPEPAQPLASRARFNSFDSGIMLSSKPFHRESTSSSIKTLLPRASDSPLTAPADPPTSNGLLAPPNVNNASATGSIAVRAMRSMRSIARMTSWAQFQEKDENGNTVISQKPKDKEQKTKEKPKGETKKKKKKEKKEEKEAKDKTIRYSGSSFEAGMLSAQGSPPPVPPKSENSAKTLGRKKQSVLGLGLPSTLRVNTMRNVSSASSMSGVPQLPSNRLSADSAHMVMNDQGRPSSTFSSGSSLRPPSTASGVSAFSGRSGRSSSSSVVSVRWDEEGLRTVKERQRKERTSRAQKTKESRRNSDARKRTAISDIFPDAQVQRPRSISRTNPSFERPIVTVEAATLDGHEPIAEDNVEIVETPVKRARPRPVSEQLLGRSRPQAMFEDENGVLSILDAATNDLASLISRLDLQATPGSITSSPIKPSPFSLVGSPLRVPTNDESPLKQRTNSRGDHADLRSSTASIASLRPYAQAHSAAPTIRQQPSTAASLIGQPIVPLASLNWQVSPKKTVAHTPSAVRPTHKRTPSPAVDPPLVFQPLRPARIKALTTAVTSSPGSATTPVQNWENSSPSSNTFGSRPSKSGSKGSKNEDDVEQSPSPPFRKTHRHAKGGSSSGSKHDVPIALSRSNGSSMLISREARRGLGLTGTMGASLSMEPPVDPEDPDSDIPDELHVILASQSDDECTLSFRQSLSFKNLAAPPSPGSPPQIPLPLPEPVEDHAPEVEYDIPVFRAQLFDEEANQADIDEGNGSSSEDDTKKSFDFTGELQKLNESGGSDRRSFVEQLENAFRTPARVDLGSNLNEQLGLDGRLLVPPVPALPEAFRRAPGEDVVPHNVSDINSDLSAYEGEGRDSSISATFDIQMDGSSDDHCRAYPILKTSHSMRSKASDGQLNVDFKFGGKPSVPTAVPENDESPLTLSDIIPPVSHSRSSSRTSLGEDDSVLNSIMARISERNVQSSSEDDSVINSIMAKISEQHNQSESQSSEDYSVINSIMAKASEMSPFAPRQRIDSDSNSKRQAREAANESLAIVSHSRNTSETSFVGFESFEEVRRGFEFGPNRPAFYPPEMSRPSHAKHESVYSIASISSYGSVLNPGVKDPFGYCLTRPASDDMSIAMSMSVDDTFSFLRHGQRRQRVDSDASSFYFRAPPPASTSYRRGHRPHESNASVISNGPPVSLYNRSFGGHRRSDSNTSASSVAQSYAMHGAYGGRAAWARHRNDPSVDSVSSDFSAVRLGRPGIGDKMFSSEHGMPLASISASPPESPSEGLAYDRSSYDSILDDEARISTEDSLFEKTGYRTSVSSESVFGEDEAYVQRPQPSRQFRPVSMWSMASTHSPQKEDDTMITMIGGGHIRRRSVDSMIGGSPCVRVEKGARPVVQDPPAMLLFEQEPAQTTDSPNKSRLIEKPSIASTSSHQFGGERMIMARRGLLERQSLEDSALMAQGEEWLTSLRAQPIFSRPGPASRSRSSTCTSSSSGAETPPLSCSDGSSISGGSQSSIDLGHLSDVLSNVTHPSSVVSRARARARARGTGHRRRISQAAASRSSVYETIQEESSVLLSSPSPAKSSTPPTVTSQKSHIVDDTVFVVDSDGDSVMSDWDDEHGITRLRRYYALRDEAQETVTQSKRMWSDTPFSIFAVQSFQPPINRGGMQALLEHSQKNYGPLPSELRPHRVRSRTSSRASPYPRRGYKSSIISEQSNLSKIDLCANMDLHKPFAAEPRPLSSPLQPLRPNVNIMATSPPPVLDLPKAFTPFSVELDTSRRGKNIPGLPTRPRVTSSARRTALGWSKRGSGKPSSSEQKENVSQGTLITPSDSLRINRPRPRGRPTPARGLAIRA